MGFSHVLRFCLQGGGVAVLGGSVTFDSCTITGNTATYVRAHTQNSHRPDGKMPCPNGNFTCFALVLAGRRCLCQYWHGELLGAHHRWQLSYICACPRSKVPIAQMGRWLTCPNRLSSIREMYVLATPANFPTPRWEKALLTCPFRFSSFMMGAASNYQAGVRAICA